MTDLITTQLPVLPLHNGVVFPGMVVTINIESPEAHRALAAAEAGDGRMLLVPKLDGEFATVGTIAAIQEVTRNGNTAAIIAGLARAKIGTGVIGDGETDVLWVQADPVDEDALVSNSDEVTATMEEFRAVVTEILQHRGIGPVAERILDVTEPGQLADLSVYSPDLDLAQKIEVLETVDPHKRLIKVLGWMSAILAGIELRRKVRDDATDRIEKSQRDYLLRQQLEAIANPSWAKAAKAPSTNTARSSPTAPCPRT